ncbi:MAG: hypothetical protein DRH15_02600 [Deltaproteobacteria bacterium]|nr:helix-turn-helix transcriptional regulator [Deltaproteobacteria bacterium]RLB86060.1 MAG: hypothetical protein DRH15_02600 [Deltaproteobacteria bacterium]HDM09152.1 XRE family transcriptional regulator [Desulfobacteraceae bacterium]
MPNIASLLRSEITRLARREVRSQTEGLRKTSAQYRKKISQLKRQVLELQKKVARLEKQLQVQSPVAEKQMERGRKTHRFSAKGLQSSRRRLGLSAADYGKLIGVTGQTIYKWEKGLSRPREKQLPALAEVRRMGKKEALAKLEELK